MERLLKLRTYHRLLENKLDLERSVIADAARYSAPRLSSVKKAALEKVNRMQFHRQRQLRTEQRSFRGSYRLQDRKFPIFPNQGSANARFNSLTELIPSSLRSESHLKRGSEPERCFERFEPGVWEPYFSVAVVEVSAEGERVRLSVGFLGRTLRFFLGG